MTKLTLEEQATNYDTMRHIHLVQKMLHKVVRLLLDRAENHDSTKLAAPEVEAFTEHTPKLAGLTFGSPEYFKQLEEFKPTLEHHYANNRHHPQFQRKNELWFPVVGFEESIGMLQVRGTMMATYVRVSK